MVAELETTFEPPAMYLTALFEQANGTICVGPSTEIAATFAVDDHRARTTMVMV